MGTMAFQRAMGEENDLHIKEQMAKGEDLYQVKQETSWLTQEM